MTRDEVVRGRICWLRRGRPALVAIDGEVIEPRPGWLRVHVRAEESPWTTFADLAELDVAAGVQQKIF